MVRLDQLDGTYRNKLASDRMLQTLEDHNALARGGLRGFCANAISLTPDFP